MDTADWLSPLLVVAGLATLAVASVAGRVAGRRHGLVASVMLFGVAAALWSEFRGSMQSYVYDAGTIAQAQAQAYSYVLALSACVLAVASNTTGFGFPHRSGGPGSTESPTSRDTEVAANSTT